MEIAILIAAGVWILYFIGQKNEDKKQQVTDLKPGETLGDKRKCPLCLNLINARATRCRHCRSDISNSTEESNLYKM